MREEQGLDGSFELQIATALAFDDLCYLYGGRSRRHRFMLSQQTLHMHTSRERVCRGCRVASGHPNGGSFCFAITTEFIIMCTLCKTECVLLYYRMFLLAVSVALQ